jgi:hypothetical protein
MYVCSIKAEMDRVVKLEYIDDVLRTHFPKVMLSLLGRQLEAITKRAFMLIRS